MKLLVLILFAIAAFAQSTDGDKLIYVPQKYVSSEGLQHVASLPKAAESWLTALPGIGKEIGIATREGLNAVVDVTEKFGATKVGNFVMIMIAEPSFSVNCGMCKLFSIGGIAEGSTGMAHTRTEASRMLQSRGWAKTRAWGWICSRCNTHGSTGVIPNERALPAQPDKPKRSAAELFSEGRKILSQEAE